MRTRKDGLPREVSGSTTLSKIKNSGSVAIRGADRIQAPWSYLDAPMMKTSQNFLSACWLSMMSRKRG